MFKNQIKQKAIIRFCMERQTKDINIIYNGFLRQCQ